MPLAFRLGLAALLLPVLAAAPAAANWQEDLAYEIAGLHACQVAFISHVMEREVDGRQMVMAKVHCEDQRTFDAIRYSAFDLFEFKECTLREKQSC